VSQVRLNPTDILHPDQRAKSKCYLVDGLRRAVFAWRHQGYPGTTETTRRLLQYWFEEDHVAEDGLFQFWFAQREAIETLIYLYEVAKKRRFIEMAQEFGDGPIGVYDPAIDQYPLYAFKMATGSGKTLVMAMAIVWSYFNRLREGRHEYASKFLLITPNVIVYDRLRRDFEGGRIFKEMPLIPPEWSDEWNLSIFLREDSIGAIPEFALFLTNIQQLEEGRKQDEGIEDIFGLKGVEKEFKVANRIKEVLTSCPNIMILKDEAHHIYNVEKAWKKILVELHRWLIDKYGIGINMELDFSATPKTETGAYFPWIIVDFPLKEAIEMNIVKWPLKGIVKRAREVASKSAHERYRAWIDAGIRRWREYKENLAKVGKRPILFIMCEDTRAADDVYDYLISTPDLKKRVLLIHTNVRGDIVKEDLEEARRAARTIDDPANPYYAIVSVLMLNEGWDVRNVTTIVGLRPYTSKKKILPEQVIGRGLRKMFFDQPADINSSVNVLEVIGPPGLTDILTELEQQEGITLPTFDTARPINMVTIAVDENKIEHSFEIPILSPRIRTCQLDLGKLDLRSLPRKNFKLENKVLKTKFILMDMLKDVVVVEKEWNLPVPEDSRSVIAYYTDRILNELRLPCSTNFEALYPLVKNYVVDKMFEEKVSLDDPRVLYALSEPQTEQALVNLFVERLRNLTFVEQEPELLKYIDLKGVKPFVWTKQVYPAKKCVLNFAPCDSTFEVTFCKFLDKAEDVVSFIKNTPRIGFALEYMSLNGVIRLYIPDYIIITKWGTKYVLETKGLVDEDVPKKDERAMSWCRDVTELTGEDWRYVRIDQRLFQEHYYGSFKELLEVKGLAAG